MRNYGWERRLSGGRGVVKNDLWIGKSRVI